MPEQRNFLWNQFLLTLLMTSAHSAKAAQASQVGFSIAGLGSSPTFSNYEEGQLLAASPDHNEVYLLDPTARSTDDALWTVRGIPASNVTTVVAADFNADEYTDIAIGTSDPKAPVYMIPGPLDFSRSTVSLTDVAFPLTRELPADYVDSAYPIVTAGGYTAADSTDFFITDYKYQNDKGIAYVVAFNQTNFKTLSLTQSNQVITFEGREGIQYGYSGIVVADNINGSRWLVVGSPEEPCVCYHPTIYTLGQTVPCDDAPTIMQTGLNNSRFGHSVAVAENSNGETQIAIGAPGNGKNADHKGWVFVGDNPKRPLSEWTQLYSGEGHGFLVQIAMSASRGLEFIMGNPFGHNGDGSMHVVSENEISGSATPIDCSTLGQQYFGNMNSQSGFAATAAVLKNFMGDGLFWLAVGSSHAAEANVFSPETQQKQSSESDASAAWVIGGFALFATCCFTAIMTNALDRLGRKACPSIWPDKKESLSDAKGFALLASAGDQYAEVSTHSNGSGGEGEETKEFRAESPTRAFV